MKKRLCKECGEEFTQGKSTKIFCKRQCGELNWKKRNPGRSTELSQRWKENNFIDWKYTQTISRKTKNFNKSLIISKQDFKDWISQSDLKCEYCGLQLELIARPKGVSTNHSSILSIDRKDSQKSYEKGNLAVACMFCNKVKSYCFTFEEMKIIGTLVNNARREGRLNYANMKIRHREGEN